MPAFFRLALTTVIVKCLSPNFPHGPLAWIIHEDSASRGNLARQVVQSSEKRGSLTYQKGAEQDGPRCDARFSSGVYLIAAAIAVMTRLCHVLSAVPERSSS